MQISTAFIRILFFIFSLFVFITFSITRFDLGFVGYNIAIGAIAGTLFSAIIYGIDKFAKASNLKALNITTLGLFFGYLLAQAFLALFDLTVSSGILPISQDVNQLLRLTVVLFCGYFGVILTVKAAQELTLSIPFVKFNPVQEKKKDILLDSYTLVDPRLLDLANSGLLDHQLVIPQYAIKELQSNVESGDDQIRFKSKKALDTFKKLEAMPGLDIRTIEKDAPDIQEHYLKLMWIARQIDANILTADISKIQQSEMEGLKVININFLSQVLKPITSAGEHLQIKVLRFGKEPRQGVGYLDDGTMVVINGGAEFMGQTIRALVLSVKSTPAGRMIFCNAAEGSDGEHHENDAYHTRDLETSSRFS